jgi:hypothetical protein
VVSVSVGVDGVVDGDMRIPPFSRDDVTEPQMVTNEHEWVLIAWSIVRYLFGLLQGENFDKGIFVWDGQVWTKGDWRYEDAMQEKSSSEEEETRPLTEGERELARWMLEHGTEEGKHFLTQLEAAEATSWRCPCGCASFRFRVKGYPPAPRGVHILGDFVFEDQGVLSGIFIYCSNGILRELEVCGMAGDAPKLLPSPGMLRPV